MLSILLALSLAQTPAAVRRGTPAVDDPGMVVRPVGTSSVTCTNCASGPYQPDGGLIGTVGQARGADGGTGWGVWIEGGTLAVSSSVSFDGGSIGYMRMPDGGPLEVTVTSGGGSGGAVTQGVGFDGGPAWNVAGFVSVNNFPATQAVTGPLTDVQLRASAVPVSGTVTANAGTGPWPVTDNGGSLTVDGTVTANAGTGTFAVSAASLPLPTGAATAALQTTGNTSLSSIDTKTPALGQATMAASSPVVIASNQSAVPVTMTSTTITGSVAVTGPLTDVQLRASAVPVSAAALPLPSGAATEATLSTRVADSTITARFPAGAALADATSNPTATGTASYPFYFNGTTWDRVRGATATGLLVDVSNATLATTQSGTWNVGLSAGTNYAGRFRLTDGTLDLTLLNSAPASDTGQVAVPVRVISTLGAVGGGGTSSNFGATFPAAGTAAGFSDGTNMQAARTYDTDSGGGTQNTLGVSLRASGSGGSVEAGTASSPLRVDPTGTTTQPVSVSGSIAVTGPLTDVQLRASAVPVSGTVAATQSGTWAVRNQDGAGNALASATAAPAGTEQALVVRNIPSGTQAVSGTVTANAGTGTFAVSAASLPLPTGAATAALQTTGNTSLSSIDTKTPALGQTTMASSTPVVIASNQSTVPVSLTSTTITGTVAVSAASLPLPTGAATEATLATRLADSTFTTRINTLGQKTMANSTPVTLASDQSAVPVSGTVAATQSGTWTVRNQDGSGNALASGTTTPAGTEQALIVRNIPSGTQAVSGTVTANAGTGTFAVSAASLPLPSGAATETTLGTRLADSTFTGRINTQGQKTMAASTPVVLASDQSTLNVRPVPLVTTPTPAAVTCATTATAAPASPLANRTSLAMTNNGSSTIYIGGSSVTTATGFPLPPGGIFAADVGASAYYCIVATGTVELRVLEN